MLIDADGENREERHRKTLLEIYPHICAGHNGIAEFRAKLLALLPIASGVGIFVLLKEKDAVVNAKMLLPVGLFGFVVVFGLFLYELRGIADCVLLRERAEAIEVKLGIDLETSQFRRRLPGAFYIVDEVGAGWIVYNAVMAAWLFVAGYGVLGAGGLLGHKGNSGLAPLGGALAALFLLVLALAYRHRRREATAKAAAERPRV